MGTDDLDDGEIPRDQSVSHQDCVNGEKNIASSGALPNERPSAADGHSIRSSHQSPTADRDHRHEQRRASSPRNHVVASTDSRTKSIATKKAPSVHDANTRADIGRLAREAEAAAYKARTAALSKSTSNSDARVTSRLPASSVARPPVPRSVSPRRADTRTRTRSRSPDYDRRRYDRRSPPAGPRARSPRRPRSPISSKAYASTRDTREPFSRESSSSEQTRRKVLSAADIGRMEREREAAAYKAKVLAESSRTRPTEILTARTGTTAGSHSSPASSRHQTGASSPHHTSRPAPAQEKEVVQRILSRTPKLDQQLATLKDQYESMTKDAMARDVALASALQKWVNAEREVRREEYKSELAHQSLDGTAIL